MLGPQYISPTYPVPHFNNAFQRTVAFQTVVLDANWSKTWPLVSTILVSATMLITSAAIVGLDIANLAIEGNKQNGRTALGNGPPRVGAGIWSGSISFIAAIFILVILCVKNKRVAATFALIAVTLAFLFTIVLIGLTANSIQIYNLTNGLYLESVQFKLIISILSLALFIFTLCIIFFIMYISVFFSSHTRQSTKY